MEKFKIAIGLHNHQPVGNFDFVFEDAHQKAYQPFIELLKQYPNIRLSLHQSGILWDWQEKHHPEYLTHVGEMVSSKQIEIMTGGFYEPIIISIPERDTKGQIELLDTYIKDKLRTKSIGAWLTERIWEPHLPKILNQAGVEFVPVDDTHFIYAGFELSQLTGPFITEYEGYKLTLLPISKRMRYLIPFGTVEEVITELKQMAENNPGGMVIYADDGEKFGSWPKTHQHCYVDGWLKNFFDALSENSDWLEIIPLSEAAASEPVGRAYLPSASYAEMLHWALPPQAFLEYEEFEHKLEEFELDERFSRFVRGGHWRGFLTKYEEANLMHKKMMFISDRLNELNDKFSDKPEYNQALDALYAGQCNCPYWHGVFGGLYLPHIRQAIYENLIKAEALLNSLTEQVQAVIKTDYDADGFDEVVISTKTLSSVFKPNKGGVMLELSMLDKNFSLTDTLTRRKEGYHLKLDKALTEEQATGSTKSIHDLVLAKEEGLKELLVDDWYLKRCFIDHVFTDDVDFEKFKSNKFGEYGDFVLEKYEHRCADNEIILTRNGNLWKPDGVIPFTIEKSFLFDSRESAIGITYRLSTESESSIDINFAVENNFNFQAGHAIDRFILIDNEQTDDAYLDSTGAHTGKHSYALIDQYRDIGVGLSSETKANIWHLPIFTVSLSEGGFEKVYQGTTVLHRFSIKVGTDPVILRFDLVAGTEQDVREKMRSFALVK